MYLREGESLNSLQEEMMINRIDNSDMFKILESQRGRSQRQEKKTSLRDFEDHVSDRVSLGTNQKEILTYGISRNSPLIEPDFEPLQTMLVKIFEEQGILVRIDSEGEPVNFRDITPEKARELISDEGYLGIEQTSDRIVQFALSISGNDTSRFEELKASIEKGFKMASDALGGGLPEISMKTYDAVMDKLDAWPGDSVKA